jgi:hydroxypyruvate isomerase
MMFLELPLLERFQAAKDCGFGAVEMQFPYDTPAADLAKAKADAGVEIAVVNIPAGDLAQGGPALAAMPGREALFRDAVAQCLKYAELLRPVNVNVLTGVPPAEELGRDACLDTLAGNLRHAGDVFAPLSVTVTVEAVNTFDRPGFFLSTSAQAIEAIDRAGHDNLAIEHDLYHMQKMEGDLVATLERLVGRIGHIQFADTPGRHEPGTGEINFPYIFAAIDRIGYDRWIGAEYTPSGRTEDTLGWLAPYA